MMMFKISLLPIILLTGCTAIQDCSYPTIPMSWDNIQTICKEGLYYKGHQIMKTDSRAEHHRGCYWKDNKGARWIIYVEGDEIAERHECDHAEEI